jgi:hypothetical protein
VHLPELDKTLELDEYTAVDRIYDFLSRNWYIDLNLSLREWSESEKQLFAIEYFQREVNNGGFHQYFFNSSGDFAEICAAGLERIGATEAHRLLVKGMSTFSGSYPLDPAKRQDLLEQQGDSAFDALGPLDTAYYELTFDIGSALFNLVLNNREDF